LPSDLIPNSVINCPPSASPLIVGAGDTKRLNIRPRAQDPTVPYLLSPRATVIRKPEVELVWNAVPNVQSYTSPCAAVATVGRVVTSTRLKLFRVIGKYSTGKASTKKIAYTVEICVVFNNTSKHCTTDADWSAGDNLAFYYVPTPLLDKAVEQLNVALAKTARIAFWTRRSTQPAVL